MRYIIDAFTWIEYLEGSKRGEKLNELIKEDNELYSLPITVAEVVSKVKRKKGNYELAYESIIANSKIIEVNNKIAKEAGLLHAEMRKEYEQFGIVDSLLIISARHFKAKILTGDNHFSRFKEAVLI